MSRSDYHDDIDQRDIAMWRGRVASAIRGKRGQAMLRDALAALDAMPEKVLIADELIDESGDVCLLGAVAKFRGLPVDKIDSEDHEPFAKMLNVAECLVRECEFENDEGGYYDETPQQRFERVRKWVVSKLLDHTESEVRK